MIILITGLPGHGKTLYTVATFKRFAELEGRPVYYHGISDLALPWTQLEDPTKWYEVEPNSIVILDECQRIFRPAGPGSAVPKHIEMLETHRHGGIDLVLLTQQPSLVHKNVRQLVGDHRHLVRLWGRSKATVHKWPECHMNTQARKDSTRETFKYPKEAFEWYKSAEVHTHKRSVPAWYYLLFIMPVLGLALFGGVIWWAWHNSHKPADSHQMQASAVPGQIAPGAVGQGGQQSARPMTRAQYFEQFEPRVAGLAHTAPIYDDVTKPVRAPYPAACVQMGKVCRCYTKQGTQLDTGDDLCRGIVKTGFYVAWDEERNRDSGQVVSAPAVQQPSVVSDRATSGVVIPKS